MKVQRNGVVAEVERHQYTSTAFGIGTHAMMKLDNVTSVGPMVRISAIEFGVNGITYTVAPVIVESPCDANVMMPSLYVHEAGYIYGFKFGHLSCGAIVGGPDSRSFQFGQIVNPLESPFPSVNQTELQIGQYVRLHHMFEELPVLVWGVTFREGKVFYDVSIDQEKYRNTPAWDNVYERNVCDSLHHIDSIFMHPVGGWPEQSHVETKPEPNTWEALDGLIGGNTMPSVVSGRVSCAVENQGNVPRSN